MKKTVSLFMMMAGLGIGLVSVLYNAVSGWEIFPDVGSGLTLAMALGVVTYNDIPLVVLDNIRRWHGKIGDQFASLDNLVTILGQNLTPWSVPMTLYNTLLANRNELDARIRKCRTSDGSSTDRLMRNSLLKTTIGLCLTQVKAWAINEYYAGVLTLDDVHRLGFFAPGDTSGFRARHKATDLVPEIKVKIINMDYVHVVIDQALDENAGPVLHGWPKGVRQAQIVIIAVDGRTEVVRQLTSRLHTNIRMPEGSRGKHFLAMAAFLKHVDDEPRYGQQMTFSMPVSTADLLLV
ncbi:MAG: hypothetical protein LBS12_05435 [Prevotellaceae bacterium]|jgi:hypothetical protein|nr:hypothetical protein [Prevotellaceae bacterium]